MSFSFIFLSVANWLQNAYAKSSNKVIEPGGRLLNHFFATFLNVVGNPIHMRGSVALGSLMAVLEIIVWLPTPIIALKV